MKVLALVAICWATTTATDSEGTKTCGIDEQHEALPEIFFSSVGVEMKEHFSYHKRMRPNIANINIGLAYKPPMGYFVAPVAGVYLFQFYGLNGEKGGADTFITTGNFNNSGWMKATRARMSTQTHTIMELEAGQIVEVLAAEGMLDPEYVPGHTLTTDQLVRFSGQLIAPRYHDENPLLL